MRSPGDGFRKAYLLFISIPIIGTGFKLLMDVIGDMANAIAETLDGGMTAAAEAMTNTKVHLLLIFISFVGAQAALVVGAVPTIVGSVALGLLAGFAFWGWKTIVDPPTQYDKVVEEEIIPYNQWPDQCYVCGDEIPDDMHYRGQMVIHKGESESETKAAPLCESCTWTYATLMDNHEMLVGAYDRRGNPVDL